VARLAPNGGLHVFERAGTVADIYITCSLQPWLSESRVIAQSLGTASPEENDMQLLLDQQDLAVPARPPPGAFLRTPKKPQDRRGALARLSILPERHDTAEGQPEIESQIKACSRPPTPVLQNTNAEDSIHLALDVDQLRIQYLETLYLSKTSLAYFAKGPLARARTMLLQEKLLNFYRESIISTKKLDLKYRDSANKIIESVKGSRQIDGSVEEYSRKASRKKKMGKDALYPAEEEYVRRCWLEREVRHSKSVTAESQAQEQRKLVSDLRTRETKMQILLILELILLQTAPSIPQAQALSTENVVKTEEQAGDSTPVFAKTPIKSIHKPKNYSSDLETLVDRLCIWHTVGIDDMFISPEKKDQEARNSSGRKDQLGDFCAETIVPFYASRLPEQCKMICRKLGGSETSPQQPKLASTKSTSTTQIPPGAGGQRRPRALPKKTLERVLSDDRSLRHASPPTLVRSATAPLIPRMKRETPETFQRPASRGALYKSVSFSNREIDLHADARVQETKRRKLARVTEQKQELDAAIAALKRPNRTVAAQGLMDEIESRKLESSTRKQSVHITATPRRPKSRSSSHHEPALPPAHASLDDHTIPSSTARPRRSYQWQPPMSAKKRAVLFAIHETPARLSSSHQVMPKPVSRLNFPGVPKSDNISSDPTLVESTPATDRLRPDLLTQVENTPMRMSKSMRPVLFTPLKKTEVRMEDAFRDAPIIPAGAGKAMDRVMGGGATEMSVYDALGWNDDYDL
jgi:hypothetical protein